MNGNPRAEQACAEARTPDAPVALARHEERRIPALVLSQPQPNEVGEGLNILADPEVARAGRRIGQAAVARARGINQHDVSEIQPGFLVVNGLIGRLGQAPVVVHRRTLGAKRTHV